MLKISNKRNIKVTRKNIITLIHALNKESDLIKNKALEVLNSATSAPITVSHCTFIDRKKK
jgi:hypothetical protein